MGRHTIHVGAGAPARPAGHSPAGLNCPPTWRAVLAHTDEGVRILRGPFRRKVQAVSAATHSLRTDTNDRTYHLIYQ